MDYKWGKLSNLGYFKIFELNTPSNGIFYGLSENHKITEIRPTKLKLWPFGEFKGNCTCTHVTRQVYPP